jgi:hypothetical protein
LWFSQSITVGESERARVFERTTIDGLFGVQTPQGGGP